MKRRRIRRPAPVAALVVAALVLPGCSDPGGGKRTAVASFYPLAYAAERILGSGWEVIDLTPPGTEAHDIELSLEDRTSVEEAEVVIYLGQIGFQPQVEQAVTETSGLVVDFHRNFNLSQDPHIWLDPTAFSHLALFMASRLRQEEPEAIDRARDLENDLQRLHGEFLRGLRDCRFETMIVSHEAFGYLAGAYGVGQVGLAGITPEGEPSSNRLAEAQRLIELGHAGAVFYENSDEQSRRTAESLANDTGVSALPLSTLESEPPEGDYLSVMEDNLDSLRQGLECQ